MLTSCYAPILKFHVLMGGLALLSGLLIILMQKGTTFHRKTGMIYYYCMIGVCVTTLILFGLKPEKESLWFLSAVAVIAFYQTFAGKEILASKGKVLKMRFISNALLFLLLLTAGISAFASVFFLWEQKVFLGILFGFFAFLGGSTAMHDYKLFTGKIKREKGHWLFHHINRMMTAYIFTLTAFLVNVIPRYIPEGTPMIFFLMIWILPGIIIGTFTARYIKGLKTKKRPMPSAVPLSSIPE